MKNCETQLPAFVFQLTNDNGDADEVWQQIIFMPCLVTPWLNK